MIAEVRINNFMAFSNDAELSLEADMRTKRFLENVYQSPSDFNIVKSACIYGPNNMGKSCLIRAIVCILNVIAGRGMPKSLGMLKNLFNESDEIELGITFLFNDEEYSFDFGYLEPSSDNELGVFTYERLIRKFPRKSGRCSRGELIYERSPLKYRFKNNNAVSHALHTSVNTNIAPYALNSDLYPEIDKYKSIFKSFAKTVNIVTASMIEATNTTEELKKGESGYGKDINSIISLLDADISEFKYDANKVNPILENMKSNNRRYYQQSPNEIEDMYCLFSNHHGIEVPSIAYDSNGTKTIIALSSYIAQALHNDMTLIIDEFDNGLHSFITRAIIAMFNNETNHAAQLIFTAHDISLLDTRNLFRKDQIWFLDRDRSDNEGAFTRRYLYRLDEFTAEEDGIRSDSNIEQLYKEGCFGAIPEPDLFDVMINISENRQV